MLWRAFRKKHAVRPVRRRQQDERTFRRTSGMGAARDALAAMRGATRDGLVK
jgi:hypothetical protein